MSLRGVLDAYLRTQPKASYPTRKIRGIFRYLRHQGDWTVENVAWYRDAEAFYADLLYGDGEKMLDASDKRSEYGE